MVPPGLGMRNAAKALLKTQNATHSNVLIWFT
jgi:hypothetical protein